jgi:S1-C subfamily serine protease
MTKTLIAIVNASGIGRRVLFSSVFSGDAERSGFSGAIRGICIKGEIARLDALGCASRLSSDRYGVVVLNALVTALVVLLSAGCAHEKPPETVAHPELAVVHIRSVFPKSAGATEGIGFLISPDGLVATCSRFVDRDASISVTLSDGRSLPATFEQEDREGRIALIKVTGKPEEKLPFLPLQGDEFLPGVHIRAVGTSGVVHGEFEQFENLGSDVGFTAGGPVESGGPLLMDDNTVIGVVQGPADNRPGVQLATPVWRITRMVPSKAAGQ